MNIELVNVEALKDWCKTIDVICVWVGRNDEIDLARSVPAQYMLNQLGPDVCETAVNDYDGPPALVGEAEGDSVAALLLGTDLKEVDFVHLGCSPLESPQSRCAIGFTSFRPPRA